MGLNGAAAAHVSGLRCILVALGAWGDKTRVGVLGEDVLVRGGTLICGHLEKAHVGSVFPRSLRGFAVGLPVTIFPIRALLVAPRSVSTYSGAHRRQV